MNLCTLCPVSIPIKGGKPIYDSDKSLKSR